MRKSEKKKKLHIVLDAREILVRATHLNWYLELKAVINLEGKWKCVVIFLSDLKQSRVRYIILRLLKASVKAFFFKVWDKWWTGIEETTIRSPHPNIIKHFYIFCCGYDFWTKKKLYFKFCARKLNQARFTNSNVLCCWKYFAMIEAVKSYNFEALCFGSFSKELTYIWPILYLYFMF